MCLVSQRIFGVFGIVRMQNVAVHILCDKTNYIFTGICSVAAAKHTINFLVASTGIITWGVGFVIESA